ncbi:uncharacterized protein A1O9_10162 [Exophiala aquamarina CBS 119918]|uniref:Uncharacterized protein n=1 Tax=Exophiala aquamarina CBS 119918 TaxID=1182545 RepID=A0A072P1T5_9EURO|nr:uncharacterized protein A1O9_10162 [Exophiala aquamarina CBS 119918]KEF53761.1 hypothetical protein A1O9_10162 [Exophiala aquamarina CBS 119918]
MSANSGNGGVRNLRAMFENKAGDQSTSPPSRGRSPNPSEFSNGSRPVSKVRASFVAVERPGENGGPPILGLRRASEVSSLGGIQENAIADGGHLERSYTARTDPDMKEDTRPQLARAPSSTNGTVEGGLGKILKGSSFADPSTPSKAPKATSATPNAKNLGEALSSGKLQSQAPKAATSKATDSTKAATMVKNMKSDGKSGPPPATTLQTTKSAQPVKPPPTRLAVKSAPKSPVISKPSPKTPTSPVASIKGGPAKIKGVMDSAKQSQQARAEKQSATKQERAPPAPKLDTQAKVKPASDAVRKEKTPASPKVSRSPKVTRTKSPTRPVRLPAGATANTTASAAKDTHHSPTDPDFRKSITKKASSLSIRQPRPSVSSTTSTLAKKPSRASLANGHDKHERPKSRVSVQASKPDEGFLARMMRPTTSSAQKTHDKVQVNSPPRPRTSTSHRPKDVTTKKAPPPKMPLVKQQIPTNEDETEIHEAGHDPSVLPEEESILPGQDESKEAKQDAPIAPEKQDEVPLPAVENTSSSNLEHQLPAEAVAEDATIEVNKEEQFEQDMEEEGQLTEAKEDAAIHEQNQTVTTSDIVEPESPVEEVKGGQEPVQENAVTV